MAWLNEAVDFILGLGPSVMLPIIIFIVALIFGVKVSKAIRSGLTIGIGFVGIGLVVGLLVDNLAPAAQQMVERFGIELTTIDMGWPAAAAGAWAFQFAALIIPIAIAVNLIMIALKWTKTLNIDIWNFWHFISIAAIAYFVTGMLWLAILCAIIRQVVCLITADKTAPMVSEFYGLEGVSIATGSTVGVGLLGMPIAWVISKIPGIKNINVDTETIQKSMGIFGEPMMMGIFIGLGIGIAAGLPLDGILNLGISLGGVMFLMPRMVKILMEGLIPISESAREFMKKRFKGRELYIGLDAAVTIGHPANIATGLILVPITLLLAVIIPGNTVLPFGDLATIPFYMAFVVGSRKGNILHSVLAGTISIGLMLLMATNMAPVHTEFMGGIMDIPEGATYVSSLDLGGNPVAWILYRFAELFRP